MNNFPPEKLENLKKGGMIIVGFLLGVWVLAILFDSSGKEGKVSIIEKPSPQIEKESPELPTNKLEQVSTMRDSLWQKVQTNCGALEIQAQTITEELRAARSQKWLIQSQAESSKTGIHNLEYLKNLVTIYGADIQKISKDGAQQIETSAKPVGEFRDKLEVLLDLAGAISNYNSNRIVPRPTVGFFGLKDQIDSCTGSVNDFLAIEQEQYRTLQDPDSTPAENGSAKAIGDENEQTEPSTEN